MLAESELSLEEMSTAYTDYINDDELSNKLQKKVKKSLSREMEINLDAPGDASEPLQDGIASVAWIIVCGEGLHNLVDGLSIGAAFSETFIKVKLIILHFIVCHVLPGVAKKTDINGILLFEQNLATPVFDLILLNLYFHLQRVLALV